MVDRFTVTTNRSGHIRQIRVIIHDTKEQMQRTAVAYSRARGLEIPEKGFAAMTHSYQRQYLDSDGVWKTKADTNIIRLYKDKLGGRVIIHESTHVALHIYSIDCMSEDDPVDEHMWSGNEKFCYLLDDIAGRIIDRLYKRGYYAGVRKR